MPSTIKVRVVKAQDLPVMDSSSKLSDAFVQVKFCSHSFQTSVARKTLNPFWDESTRITVVDDTELQSEPMVFRVMDHDVYSADDLIGTVNIALNPVLHRRKLDSTSLKNLNRSVTELNSPRRNDTVLSKTINDTIPQDEQDKVEDGDVHTIKGWFPIYDTLEGIRGKLYIVIKVQFFSDENPFKESSAGVKFFMGSILEPSVLSIESLVAFVEELVVENDPEYEWSDNFRSSRKSNESRQLLLYRLSNTVRRLVGKKALELGANAVVGYQQHFDIEGDSGLVARGFGTACVLRKLKFGS